MMEDPKTEFLLKYPSFSKISENKFNFVGNLKIKGNYFHVQLSLPKFPLMEGFHCNIYKGLNIYKLKETEICENWSVFEFLEKLPNLFCESIDKDENNLNRKVSATRQFLQQLTNLNSSNCKVHLSKSYDCIKFTDFVNYRKNFLEIKINGDFRISIANHSLPEMNNINNMFASLNTAEAYLKQFKKLLEEFTNFYANLNVLDKLCHVVEPVPITTKHDWRIFKITDKVLAKTTVNPFSPSSVSVKLIGPTYEIEKYRVVCNEGIKNWDADLDVHSNLLRIFGLLCFPLQGDSEEDSVNSDRYCNICYTYRLDGRVPIVSCDNPSCDLIFHVVCLKEWFNLNGKTVFSVTLGTCPACKEKLSASFADLL